MYCILYMHLSVFIQYTRGIAYSTVHGERMPRPSLKINTQQLAYNCLSSKQLWSLCHTFQLMSNADFKVNPIN